MKKLHLCLTILSFTVIYSCKKTPKDTIANQLPVINKIAVNLVTDSSVTLTIDIAGTGVSNITNKGVVVSTDSLPTIEKNFLKTINGSGSAGFTVKLVGLAPSRKYYARGYATNSFGTGYGNSIIFNTLSDSLPIVSIYDAEYLNDTTALSSGRISDTAKSSISAYGVVCSTDSLPTINNCFKKTVEGLAVTYLPFDFGTQIHGLAPATKYYVRVYATNRTGTAYSNSIPYQSSQLRDTLPIVHTDGIGGITESTAVGSGEILDNGGHSSIAQGLVYSTDSIPTLDNAMHTSDPLDGYGFISTLSGLNNSSTYYVRAYATTSKGTSYGNQVAFMTHPWGLTFFKDTDIDTTIFTGTLDFGQYAISVHTFAVTNNMILPSGIYLYIEVNSVIGIVEGSSQDNSSLQKVLKNGDTIHINTAGGIGCVFDTTGYILHSACNYSVKIGGRATSNQNTYYCKWNMNYDFTQEYSWASFNTDSTYLCNFQH